MRPTKGTTPPDDRWRSRRLAALFLRVAIFLVPLGMGFLAGRTVAGMLRETESATDIAVWWVAVLAASTVAATLTDRLARRLLPLTILVKMTRLFPDRAPSRMRVALRAGNFTELRKRIDIKLFVDTPPDIRFVRRLLRDVQARGRSVDSVVHQYLSTVRPMHEEFVEPSKRYADLIIPEGGENRVAIDAIIARVENLLTG